MLILTFTHQKQFDEFGFIDMTREIRVVDGNFLVVDERRGQKPMFLNERKVSK